MRLSFKYTILFFAFFSIAFSTQENDARRDEMFGLPSFVFRMHQFKSAQTDHTKLEINIALVNDVLQFVRQENGRYRAGIRISMDLVNSENEHLGEKLNSREIFAESFDETNSRNIYSRDQFEYDVKPGNHELHLEITDLETRRRLLRKFPIKLKSFQADSLQISSIMFMEPSTENDSMRYNLPKIYSAAAKGVPIRFFVSGGGAEDSTRISYTLKNWAGEVVALWDESAVFEDETLQFDQDLADKIKSAGNYTVEILASLNEQKAKSLSQFSVKYDVAQNNGEKAESDAQTYLALKYIMQRNEYQKIVNASPEERASLLKDFWNARNPEPESDVNPIRDEFYRRVEFANKHFSVLAVQQAGWETDRGEKYIIFGDPTSVQTQSDQFGAATIQLWYYRDMDRRFIFRDKKGNNDFKLLRSE